MRNWELIKQSKVLKTKIKILLNLFNDKDRLNVGEFNCATGTERVKWKFEKVWTFDHS